MGFKRKLPHRLKRFGAWLKQVILLGRTDWRKASDDVKPPRLTQWEREQLRPAFDVTAIKPRAVTAAEREVPPVGPAPITVPIPIEPSAASNSKSRLETSPESTRVRRRRRRSPQNAVNPLTAFSPEKLPTSKLAVFVEKLFGWRR